MISPIEEKGDEESGIGMTLAVVVMQSPSGNGRMVVFVVLVFMIFGQWPFGSRHWKGDVRWCDCGGSGACWQCWCLLLCL